MINYLHLCGNTISLYPNYNCRDVTSIVALRTVTSHDFEFRKGHVALSPFICPTNVHKLLNNC